jgi:soluble lytic murein transglycosylase-like protein
MMEQASLRFGVPLTWIARVMAAESGGHLYWKGKPITSAAGAMGLMQIMPVTYVELRDRYGLGEDPYEPTNSILAGAAYLAELYQHYGYPAVFAAYHAGPKRYENFLLYRDPLPNATLTYVKAIAPDLSNAFDVPVRAYRSPGNARKNSFFVAISPSMSSSLSGFGSRVPGLFVSLDDQTQ